VDEAERQPDEAEPDSGAAEAPLEREELELPDGRRVILYRRRDS
jgi:hypothetical protein